MLVIPIRVIVKSTSGVTLRRAPFSLSQFGRNSPSITILSPLTIYRPNYPHTRINDIHHYLVNITESQVIPLKSKTDRERERERDEDKSKDEEMINEVSYQSP